MAAHINHWEIVIWLDLDLQISCGIQGHAQQAEMFTLNDAFAAAKPNMTTVKHTVVNIL